MQGLPPAQAPAPGSGEPEARGCCFRQGGMGLARGGAAPKTFCGLRPRLNGGGGSGAGPRAAEASAAPEEVSRCVDGLRKLSPPPPYCCPYTCPYCTLGIQWNGAQGETYCRGTRMGNGREGAGGGGE